MAAPLASPRKANAPAPEASPAARGPSAPPLYRRIAEALRAAIAAGQPGIGGSLPGEEALCGRFGASRYTLRAALRLLEEDGLIVRRTGARSTVIAARPRQVFTQTILSLDGMLNYPADTRRHNLATGYVEADAELAALLECEAGHPWFRIEALRRSPHHPRPLCWTEIFLLPQYAAVAQRPDHEATHVVEQVQRQFGEAVERARVELLPGHVPEGMAPALEVEPGTAALVVLRRYLRRDGRCFEVTRSWHPLGRYVFSMELQRRPSPE